MQTTPISDDDLARSVISVPPLARNEDLSLNVEENRRIVKHLEAGGVTTLLYGGNALLYHVAPSEFEELLSMLETIAASDSLVIPSVGSAYGMMLDQARILRDTQYPTAMILPQPHVVTFAGVERGVRDFVQTAGKPAVVYIKQSGYLEVEHVKRLVDDGSVSWIKYAVVHEDPSDDEFLTRLCDAVGTQRIVSGIGEQPALTHVRDFGVTCFTSGCVCVAPALSMKMLAALRACDYDEVKRIQGIFEPLENLRNEINPIRVLHAAVNEAEIALMGPLLPFMSDVNDAQREQIGAVAKTLLSQR